jgi:hypothetical protein
MSYRVVRLKLKKRLFTEISNIDSYGRAERLAATLREDLTEFEQQCGYDFTVERDVPSPMIQGMKDLGS